MYTPHLWENGEVITASKLNAIELGIDQKVDTPSEAGTPGQVLTLNGDLQPYWGDGGGSGTGATSLAPAFSISVNYYPPDLVLYNNKLYRCIQSHYGSWNAAHFTEVTVADELNGVNWDENNLTQFYHSHGLQKLAPVFDSTATYQIGDYVLYAGYLYKNLTGTTGTDPSIDRTNWEYCPPVRESTSGGGTVTDVRVNSVSVLGGEGVANIPIASANDAGAIKVRNGDNGLTVTSGFIATYPATSSDIKGGAHAYRQPATNRQHEAVFYGLAKAAGVDLKDETVTVGTYTNNAKSAIKNMIGVGDGVTVSNKIATVEDLNGFEPLPSGGTAGQVLGLDSNLALIWMDIPDSIEEGGAWS